MSNEIKSGIVIVLVFCVSLFLVDYCGDRIPKEVSDEINPTSSALVKLNSLNYETSNYDLAELDSLIEECSGFGEEADDAIKTEDVIRSHFTSMVEAKTKLNEVIASKQKKLEEVKNNFPGYKKYLLWSRLQITPGILLGISGLYLGIYLVFTFTDLIELSWKR